MNGQDTSKVESFPVDKLTVLPAISGGGNQWLEQFIRFFIHKYALGDWFGQYKEGSQAQNYLRIQADWSWLTENDPGQHWWYPNCHAFGILLDTIWAACSADVWTDAYVRTLAYLDGCNLSISLLWHVRSYLPILSNINYPFVHSIVTKQGQIRSVVWFARIKRRQIRIGGSELIRSEVILIERQ